MTYKAGGDSARLWKTKDAVLEQVACLFCNLCLDGVGGECHTPGCIFWMSHGPVASIREVVKQKL